MIFVLVAKHLMLVEIILDLELNEKLESNDSILYELHCGCFLAISVDPMFVTDCYQQWWLFLSPL